MYSKKEKKDLVQRFWIEFDQYCSTIDKLKYRRRTWLLHKTKVPNVHLLFDLNRSGVEVAIEIGHRNELLRLEMYEKLCTYKVILEEDLEGCLIWEPDYLRPNGTAVSRIYIKGEDLDYHRQDTWKNIFQFMALNMYRLERNFIEIRELIQE